MGTGTLKRLSPVRTLGAVCVAVAVAALAGAPSCSSSSTSSDRPDGGTVCQHGGTQCNATTEFCANGNCVATCPDGGCPSGQFCLGDSGIDQVCAPTNPRLCLTLFDCPPPQDCIGNLCTAAEPLADGGLSVCNPDGSTNDGCGPDAICVILNSSNGGTFVQCRGMPACAQNRGCPVGSFGSTCNLLADGGRILSGKQPVCLLGSCTGAIDCASGQHCVLDPVPSPISGGCYSGLPGSPCNTKADCSLDAGCADAGPGTWGTCTL